MWLRRVQNKLPATLFAGVGAAMKIYHVRKLLTKNGRKMRIFPTFYTIFAHLSSRRQLIEKLWKCHLISLSINKCAVSNVNKMHCFRIYRAIGYERMTANSSRHWHIYARRRG